MKLAFGIILSFVVTWTHAQVSANVYHEPIEGGYAIWADNGEYCPITVHIDFELTNLVVCDSTNDRVFVLSPNRKRQLLTKLVVKDPFFPSKFTYTSKANFGNHRDSSYDHNFDYWLPFPENKSYTIDQGYHGTFSHKGIKALDFGMPQGTPIHAIRTGTIVRVIQENDLSCGTEECKKYNNSILIYHEDGTFAEYAHIRKNGAIVKPGEIVKQGQAIGYSGNVGWTTGPHLHLVVFLARLDHRVTLETSFLTGDGGESQVLIENMTYHRGY